MQGIMGQSETRGEGALHWSPAAATRNLNKAQRETSDGFEQAGAGNTFMSQVWFFFFVFFSSLVLKQLADLTDRGCSRGQAAWRAPHSSGDVAWTKRADEGNAM